MALNVAPCEPWVPDAIYRAYQAVKVVTWNGAYYRTDIGKKALSGA